MTAGLDLLRALADVRTFEPVPLATQMAAKYVTFAELTGEACESRLREAILRTERTAVIGQVGAGKTNLIQMVVEEIPDAAPLLVSAAFERDVVLGDPVEFARHMIREIVRWARAVDVMSAKERESALVESAAVRQRLTVQRTDTLGIRFAAKWIVEPSWSREIQETLADPEVERLGSEVLDSLDRLVDRIYEWGRVPILIVDDMDRWLASQGFDEDRVGAFFGETCRMIARMNWAVVLAVHPRYCATDAFRTASRDGYVSCTIDVPGLPSPDAIRLLLDVRVRAGWRDVCELLVAERGDLEDGGPSPGADDVFEEGYDFELFNWYRNPERADNLRSVLSVVHRSLNEAVARGDDVISNAALRQEMAELE